ncbi:hypothetical protein ACFP3I_25260 [Chryseobacterium arachidis]
MSYSVIIIVIISIIGFRWWGWLVIIFEIEILQTTLITRVVFFI